MNIQPDGSYMPNKQNNQEGRGFMDLWFFSNSKLMDKFGSLYDNISNYDISPHRYHFSLLHKLQRKNINFIVGMIMNLFVEKYLNH